MTFELEYKNGIWQITHESGSILFTEPKLNEWKLYSCAEELKNKLI